MKKITLLFMLLVGLTMSAQNKLNFSEAIQVEGVSKSELHERAFNWFINTFRNANNVIQVNDKENGQNGESKYNNLQIGLSYKF